MVSPNSDYDRSKNSPSPTKYRSDIEEVETLQLTRKEKKPSMENNGEESNNSEVKEAAEEENTVVAQTDPK